MKRHRIFISAFFIVFALLMVSFERFSFAEGDEKLVYFVPVEQEVERGLEAFLRRSLTEAESEGADHVVFEINTPGGLVNAAGNIAKLLRESAIPTTAYITKDALSAGAYISLNSDQIVMAPGSRMGAAAVIDQQGNTADDKAVSAWLADMKASAELNGRDPLYALAMADPDIDLPEYGAGKGELLTLTASQAIEVGYAEAIADDREALLDYLELGNAEVKEIEITFAERIARFVTHPIVVPILLSIGSIGLVLELYSPGFGIPGFMGAGALLLYFFGHAIAGFAGWETFILLAAGIGLILFEVLTPGFGFFGIAGIIAVIVSVVLSSSLSLENSVLSIAITFVLTVIASILYIKYFGYKGFLKKLVLQDATSTEKGYVSNETKEEIVGRIGKTVTPLRPSGTAVFDDDRYDVVSEGGYIEQGKDVVIIHSQGSRIVVREVEYDSKT